MSFSAELRQSKPWKLKKFSQKSLKTLLKFFQIFFSFFKSFHFKICFSIELFYYDSQTSLNYTFSLRFFITTEKTTQFETIFLYFLRLYRIILCYLHSNRLSLFIFWFRYLLRMSLGNNIFYLYAKKIFSIFFELLFWIVFGKFIITMIMYLKGSRNIQGFALIRAVLFNFCMFLVFFEFFCILCRTSFNKRDLKKKPTKLKRKNTRFLRLFLSNGFSEQIYTIQINFTLEIKEVNRVIDEKRKEKIKPICLFNVVPKNWPVLIMFFFGMKCCKTNAFC